jgi:hypothetical protein
LTLRRTIIAVAALAAAGCHSAAGQLGTENAAVRVSTTALDFGSVYVGANPQQILSILNSGGAPDTVTVGAVSNGTFTAASGTFTLGGGDSEGVALTFVPTQPGPAQATVHVGWTGGSVEVALSGIGVAQPPCVPQGLCGAAAFDPNSGVCNQTTQPDGTACADSAGCLSNASCHAGQCLGTLASCDDGNACTSDICVIGQGCASTPIACPASADPCQASSCDPLRGCVSNQVPDGTACSSTESCQSATVCLSGACTGTPVPDGTPCSVGWAPCVTDAACKAGSCDSPTADAFQPGDVQWSGELAAEGGLAIDATGGLYFVASGSGATGGHIVGLDQCGNSRWTSSAAASTDVMLDGNQLVSLDSSVPQLQGIDVPTGATLWTLSIPSVLPALCPSSDFGGSQGGASLSPPAMSSQGQIFVAGSCSTQDHGSTGFLLAVFRDGTVDWLIPAPFADAAPVVDSGGNVYFVTDQSGGGKLLSSYDPTGAARFTPVSYGGDSDAQLVVGTSQVVDIANGQAFSLTGTAGFNLDVDTGPFANAFYASLQATGGTVDGTGNVYFPFAGSSGGNNALEWGGVSPSGSLLWSLAFGNDDDVASSPVLSAEGTLLTVESQSQNDTETQTTPAASLVAVDTSSGSLLWTKTVTGGGSLALGPSGMLLLGGSPGNNVQGVYAGQLHLSTTAPWSRSRGDNTNRSAAVGP